jgi:zinc protease
MIALLLLACGPKSAPPAETAATADFRSTQPAPLPARPFVMPIPAKATLSNGIPVVVVENHETPLVYARMVFRAGAASDPRPGLAYATLDMMNEGVAGMSAEQLSAATKKLATNLGAAARMDASEVAMSCLKVNLAPSLDLMASVVKEPTFPKSEWAIVEQQHLQDLEAARDNPNSVADRVFDAVTWSGGYIGNLPTAKDIETMTVGDMKKWYDRFLAPQNAILLVGGDTTLAEVQPLLESRFGSWKKSGATPAKPDPSLRHVESATTVYLVDRPGAAQSVLQVGVFVGDRSDREAYYAKKIADVAIAGMFTSRVNLNLREAKGYTYGASGGTMYDALEGRWEATTGVRTDATVPALKELLSEIGAPRGDKPFTQAELDAARGYWLGTFPLRFESPDFYLDQMAEQWLYGLPEDWVTAMPGGVQAVSVDAMNSVWKDRVRADAVTVVVVGDKAAIGTDLAALGYPVIDVDPDGKPLKL